jgi:hypothetical protein
MDISTRMLIIGIIYDETINRLPLVTKHKDYVFQEIKKIEQKHYGVAKENHRRFNKAYELANEAWIMSQKDFKDNGLEFSNVLFMKFLRDKENWLYEYFNLSQKRIDKLEKSYDLTKHSFRSLKIVNTVLQNIDIVLSYDSHRTISGI